MEIVRDDIRFDTPVGWEDITNYNFRSAKGDEQLTVDICLPDDPPSSLAATLNERKANLLALFGERVQIHQEADTRVGSFPGRQLAFSVSTEEAKHFFWFAIAALDAAQRIELVYETPLDRLMYEPFFEHIKASPRFRSSVPNDIPDGFIARCVGPVVLFVPVPLAPPRSYFLVAEDRAAQIQVALWNKTEEPPLSAFPDTSLMASGDGQQRKAVDFPLNGISATATRSVTSRKTLTELQEDVIWECRLRLDGAQQARINGKSPVKQEPDLLHKMRLLAQNIGA